MLFPGEGSQTADMREAAERHRPDLLELARSEVSDDLFERGGEGTAWRGLQFSVQRWPDGPARVLTDLVRKSRDGVEAEAPLAMEAANA